MIDRGLIIAEPWISKILSGEKTWEMRSSAIRFRGPFGLIAKGTGSVVGVARLTDVLDPLADEDMLASIGKHCIPAQMIRSGEVARWRRPWVLEDVERLEAPISYRHKSGAVSWITLDPEVGKAIRAQLRGESQIIVSEGRRHSSLELLVPPSTVPTARQIGLIPLSEGNIRNNHFYLRSVIDCFPTDVIGGSNKSHMATRTVVIDWGGAAPAQTDIDGQKKFFRARGWIRSFFEANQASPGDIVRLEQTSPYTYKVELQKS